MWMSYLIDGLDDGRFAFYIKLHHSVIDGVAGFQMVADALSPDPQQRSMPPFYAAPRHRPNAQAARDGLRSPNPLPAAPVIGGCCGVGRRA